MEKIEERRGKSEQKEKALFGWMFISELDLHLCLIYPMSSANHNLLDCFT